MPLKALPAWFYFPKGGSSLSSDEQSQLIAKVYATEAEQIGQSCPGVLIQRARHGVETVGHVSWASSLSAMTSSALLRVRWITLDSGNLEELGTSSFPGAREDALVCAHRVPLVGCRSGHGVNGRGVWMDANHCDQVPLVCLGRSQCVCRPR